MLEIIEHRRNTIDDLVKTDRQYGVEIDLRSHAFCAGSLYLAHDPWTPGEDFEVWLSAFVDLGIQGPIILNTKEDNLEPQIEARLKFYGINRYFFLDTAPATLVRRCRAGMGARMAARVSLYEPVESLSVYQSSNADYRPAWLWVDCFDGLPLDTRQLQLLSKQYRLCLVSPELHGFPVEDIPRFHGLHAIATAVCTKQPLVWSRTH